MEKLKKEVEEFMEETGLGKKATRLMLEAWRRFYMQEHHHLGKPLKSMWLGLGFASAYTRAKGMFIPVNGLSKGNVIWWSLTELGETAFKALDKKIKWNYRYSQLIFDGGII